MDTRKRLSALLAAGALGFFVVGTVMAGAEPDWATVTGHAPHSATDNDPGTWGQDCWKLEAGEGDLGLEDDWYVLGASYGLVVVKAGSGENANTLFANASAGEAVWADVNGNNVFDEGDKGISHIIFCDEQEEETDEPSFEQSEEVETDEPSEVVETEEPSEVVETEEPSFEQSQEVETEEPSEVVETEEPSEVVETEEPSFEQSQEGETDEPSFEQSQEGETDEPSLPDTASLGGSDVARPADSAWMLVVALGMLLASIVVLTPARAKAPRR
jgi:hypothetical protein